MKIYTRTGDKGTTSLVGGTRVAKDDLRLQAYGTVDELNSWLGLVMASATQILPEKDKALLTWIQNKLFDLGSELATEPDSKWRPSEISADDVAVLERAIDRVTEALPQHNRFILPGGSVPSAHAQIARTVARRAERRMVTLTAHAPVAEPAMRFVNRLSDYLFTLARQLNLLASVPEVYWDKDAQSPE